MRVNTFYRCLLALPLVVPLVLLSLARSSPALDWVERVAIVSVMALVMGGIAYFVLAAILLIWMRRRTEADIRVAMFLSPLLMVLLLGGETVVANVVGGYLPFSRNVLYTWRLLSAYALALGYGYVVLAVILVWIGKRVHVIRESGRSVA